MIQPVILVLVVLAIVSANAFTTFQTQSLICINQLRAKHCAAPLVLDDLLNAVAQAYAEKLIATNSFVFSGGPYGENLYQMSSNARLRILLGNTPCQSWYEETTDYNFNNPAYSADTGHFTQLVWKNTRKLGVGLGFNSGNTTATVVANFSPAGNVRHHFDTQVLRPVCAK